MDFELDDEELALAESVRSICNARFGTERIKELADAPTAAHDRKGWEVLAEAGVFSLQVPEEDGGVGLGMGAASVVFEELGRALVPGPLVDSHLAARDLPKVIGALREERGGEDLVVGSLTLDEGDDAAVPLLVPHLETADCLVVVMDDGLGLLDPRELSATAVAEPLDPLTPTSLVHSLPSPKPVADAAAAARWRRDAIILTSAFLVGSAARCVEMAVDYAKQREQFGRPIGSFQAVKHICADMLVRSELARVATQAAALCVDQDGVGDPERAAAGAAKLAVEASTLNARACIQVHGGMGFTWEVPAHLFLVRARTLATFLPSQGRLAERVAELY